MAEFSCNFAVCLSWRCALRFSCAPFLDYIAFSAISLRVLHFFVFSSSIGALLSVPLPDDSCCVSPFFRLLAHVFSYILIITILITMFYYIQCLLSICFTADVFVP